MKETEKADLPAGSGLSLRARSITPSRTIAMNRLAQDMISRGEPVIDLTVGEPDFDTPRPVRAAAEESIEAGYTRYTAVPGYAELREAICRKLRRDNGLEYSPEQILVSNGAKHSLCTALLSLVDPGDEVIIPAPYWVSYSEQTRLAGGLPVIISTDADKGYKISASQLEAAISPRTKALVICSPSNPSGAVYSHAELAALARVLADHRRVWIISDEVYERIEYGAGHSSPAAFPELTGRVALVNGVSKAFAMTGWRIGYLAGPAALVGAAVRLQSQMTGNASSVSQRAALAALESCEDGGPDPVAPMVAEFRKRRDFMYGALRSLRGLSLCIPEGAFYLFPDVRALPEWQSAPEGKRSDAISRLFLEKARVATVPGSAFGDDRSVRFSFASSPANLAEASARLEKLLGRK